jgi:hypothetical protein
MVCFAFFFVIIGDIGDVIGGTAIGGGAGGAATGGGGTVIGDGMLLGISNDGPSVASVRPPPSSSSHGFPSSSGVGCCCFFSSFTEELVFGRGADPRRSGYPGDRLP